MQAVKFIVLKQDEAAPEVALMCAEQMEGSVVTKAENWNFVEAQDTGSNLFNNCFTL